MSSDRYRDKTQAEYSSHALALNVLQKHHARKVLDIGCGLGHVASRCEQSGMQVTGIDCVTPLPKTMTEFHSVNLEHDPLPVSISQFDAMLLLDVIEHLADPEEFLLSIRNADHENSEDATQEPMPSEPDQNHPFVSSASDSPNSSTQNHRDNIPATNDSPPADNKTSQPLLILSTPNIAFAAIRLNLLFGQFRYAERGILDITHKRLFTKRSLLQMLRVCGYEIERVHGVGVPFSAVMPGRTGRMLGWAANLLAKLWPSLFAFQILVECRPRPGVNQVLKNAIRIHELTSANNSLENNNEPGHPEPHEMLE